MEWFYWAISAGILFTILTTITGKLMEKEDQKVISFIFSVMITIFLIPVLFLFDFPSLTNILILFIFSIFIVIQNILNFHAFKFISPATISIIVKTRLIWTLIGSYFIFNELFSTYKIIGVVCIITAAIVLTDFKDFSIKKGIYMVLVVAVIASGLTLASEYLLDFIHPLMFLFFIALFPAIIQTGIPGNIKKGKDLILRRPKLILIWTAVGALFNIAGNYAIKYGDVGSVSLVMQSSIVLILGAEVFFLGRRERLWQKIVAVILSLAGLALIFLQ